MPVMAPALKASSRPPASELDRRLRGAHVGAHRDVHADEAGGARQHRADREADRDQPAEQSSRRCRKITTPTMPMVVYWRLR